MSNAWQGFVSGGAAAVIVAAAGVWFSRRSAREANRNQKRLVDLQVLDRTVAALNSEVERLQESLEAANGELDRANERARMLNEELDTAQHNVLILSNHIRRYVPERPFPELRPMRNV